jgi:broad specificity phosphatase PhoE
MAELIGTELGLTPHVAPLLAEHYKEETFDAVRKRVQAFLTSLDQEEHARVGLVIHGSPIKALLLALSKGGTTLNLDSYKFSMTIMFPLPRCDTPAGSNRAGGLI